MCSNINHNENLSPLVKEYINQIYKFFLNDDFRSKALETFNLSNDIFKKSNKKAFAHRQSGNQLFKEGKYLEALKHYSEGVKYAQHDDEKESELCLLFSNRSLTFFKVANYDSSLSDLKYALKLCKTEKQRIKLNERKKECVLKIQTLKKADQYCDSINNGIRPMKDSHLKKALFQFELISKEKPSQSLLKDNHFYFNCFNCFKPLQLYQTYYCFKCNQVQFCSYSCLDQSWNSGHSYFCLYLGIFNHLPYKDLFQYPPLLALLSLLSIDLYKIFDEIRNGKLIDWFQDLEDFNKNETDNIKMAKNAAFLLTYLTTIQKLPFKRKNTELKYDIELFAFLIMVYLKKFEKEVTVISCFKLSESIDKTEFKILEKVEIGYGIYSHLNQIQHSCCPNSFISNFNDKELNLRLIRDLAEGEEVTFDHGINCKSYTLEERKAKLLNKFNINCQCRACLDLKEPLSQAYLCSYCSGPVVFKPKAECLDCNQISFFNLEENENIVKAAVRDGCQGGLLLIRSDPDLRKAEKYLLDSFRSLKSILYPSNINFLKICDGLSLCYKRMRNYRLSYIYAEHAMRCAKQDVPFGYSYFNMLLKLIQRQNNFINFVKKNKKADEKEYQKLFKEAIESIENNINEAEKLIVHLTTGSDTNYFKKVLKEMKL